MPLPLSHRILLVTNRAPRTARWLSRKFETNRQTVHKTLRGLEEMALLDEEGSDPATWETPDDVDVVYHPGRIDVFRDGERAIVNGELDGEAAGDGRCEAVTTRGHRCKLDAREGSSFCRHHQP